MDDLTTYHACPECCCLKCEASRRFLGRVEALQRGTDDTPGIEIAREFSRERDALLFPQRERN